MPSRAQRLPSSASGKRIDFKLNEECLLKVVLEDGDAAKAIPLATRDTPESLRKALADDAARRRAEEGMGQTRRGIFAGLRRMLGGT